MKFIEHKFYKNLSLHLDSNERLLLNKVVDTLKPTPKLLNIAHQLSSLLNSLLSLNKIDLPVTLQENNEKLITLLEKISEITIFKKKIANEYQRGDNKNILSGIMLEYPIGALFSISVFNKANDNTRQVFYCISAIIFLSYFYKVPKFVLNTIETRVFIEKHYDIKLEKKFDIEIEKSISSLNMERLISIWFSLLSQASRLKKCHLSLASYVERLLDIQPINLTDEFTYSSKHSTPDEPSLEHHKSNLTPTKKIQSNTNESISKRRYIPQLKHQEDVAEDNSTELTELSVEPKYYIDEQALDQSYLYGSRLALQELMQLSFRPVALLDSEVFFIIERVKQGLCSDDMGELKTAVLSLLLICTSKGYEYIEALPINRNLTENACTDSICLQTKTWNRFDVKMPQSFAANDDQKKHLEKVDHLLPLSLPTLLMTAIEKLLNDKCVDCITVKALCNSDETTLISQQITDFFHCGHLQYRNITPASLRNLLFELISKKETPAIASLLLANTEYASNTSLYYLFQSHQKMGLLYQETLTKLGFDCTPLSYQSDLFCGSELAIQLWHSKNIISAKYSTITTAYEQLNEHSSLSELIEIHNQITLYIVLTLLITTGHRSRKEYSFSNFTIDEEKALACISDKQNFCDSALRILPLADSALENLKAYRTHCDRLSRLILKYSSTLTQKLLITSQNIIDTNQPLLYLINQDLSITPVGHDHIEKYLSEWNLPTNAFRHYFFTFLQNTGAKHVAANFMGHIRSGEHIYSNDSLFCNDDMTEMKRAINSLAESLNCLPLAFSAKAGRRVPLKSDEKGNIYIPHYLSKGQVLNKKKLRHEVRKLVADAYKDKLLSFENIQVTKETLQAKILEQNNLSTHALNFKFKMLDTFIRRWAGKKKLPSISKTYADNEDSGLTLRTDSLFKAKEAQQVKEVLQTWLLSETQNEKMSKNTANREFIKIILSLIVHSSFSFSLDTEFINALKSPTFKDGNILWLAWIDGKQNKRRIFIDSITAQLLINNPIYLKTKLQHPSEIGKKIFHYLSVKLKKLHLQEKLIGNKSINLNKLIKFLNNRFFFTHTGLSQSYLNQRHQTTHLPNEVLTRWLRDEPCYKLETQEKQESTFTSQSLTPPKKREIDDKSVLLGVQILAETREQLNLLFTQSGYTSSQKLISIVRRSWEKAIGFSDAGDLQALINQSDSLTESTIAALCWIYHTAGKPGKGRKTIAIKTLLSYISKVAKPLVVTANTQPFFTMTKSELQSLYIETIASRNVKNKNEAAEVLRTFDHYIYDNFKLPKVSWLEVEPSIYSQAKTVRSNIMSYREYEETVRYLKNEGSLSADERLINHTIFTLCYRLGLRKSEAENLMVNEIDFENGILHIKTNRYDRVKTPKSNRRIPMSLFLSAEEIDDLKQLVRQIMQFNDQKKNIGIFSRPLDSSKLIDFTSHEKEITQAMKEVMHDPAASLHICRHSFANYLYLCVCRGTLPASINNELKAWSREPCDHQEFTKQLIHYLINEHASKHKVLHAISLLLGHEEIATTITNYIHVLDIISAAENEKLINESIQIKHVKWVNKLSISNASKIVSRFDSLTRRHCAISYHQLKKITHFKEVDVVRIEANAVSTEINWHPVKSHNSLLHSLSMIETLIRASEDGLCIEDTAKKVTFSETEIHNITQIITQLKSQTAYDGIIVHSSDPNIAFFNNHAKSQTTKNYINSPAYKDILNKLNKIDHETIDSLVSIWLKNYNRNITGYTIRREVDEELFHNIINNLGYKLHVKNERFIVKDKAQSISTRLFDLINPTIGEAKNAINLKFDHALFLLAINTRFLNL